MGIWRSVGRSLLLVGLIVGGAALPVLAARPHLARIAPCGGQRGTEVDVVLGGQRLGDAQELMLYEPGIRVVKLEPKDDGTLNARLALAPDCRVGLHAVRIRSATGISNLQLFSVGVLPELQESEPNNDFAQPQKIPLNVTVNGVVRNEDVDHFLVEAKKGQRLSAEIEGIRLGQTFFDPSLEILDARRYVLAGADDTPLVRQDAAVSVVVPADGTYIVRVRESAFGGADDCRYRLHVGTFPRPFAVYPAGGRPGETLEIRWLGDALGERIEKLTLPASTASPNGFSVLAQDAVGVAPSANAFRLADLKNVLENEPNDAPAQATPAEAPAALNGILGKPGDVDCFRFAAKQGQVFDVRVHARSLRTPVDPVLTVLRSNGAAVAANDDTDTPDSYLRFTAPADDQYVVQVRDQLASGGTEYVYRVEVALVQPRLVLGLPERTQFEDIVAPVPAGNRLAFLVSVQREDFGGPVSLELKGLPPGVSAEVMPFGPEDGTVPVLLSAAPDAKPAGALVDLVGRHQAGNLVVEGHLRQRTSLVRGANNREVCNHYTDRLAAAVTQAAPFALEIVQPKVPLVQSGTMELRVRAHRQPGFQAPITLHMLYNPPGVSSPVSVTLPEGQSEARIPLTADGGAAVRTWKVAVLGEAVVGNGPVMVSSQLASLEVAEPFFRFQFPIVSVDQGQATEWVIKVEKRKDFAGTARVELLGVPHGVSAEPREFNKDAGEVHFVVKTSGDSPVGQHKSLVCRAVVMAEGEPITHLLGSGELRIQKPLPPKAAAAPPKPAGPPAAPKPAPRALGRLEKLRMEKQQGK